MILPPTLDAKFLLHLGPLGDVIPIPFPFIQNVASVGDVFLGRPGVLPVRRASSGSRRTTSRKRGGRRGVRSTAPAPRPRPGAPGSAPALAERGRPSERPLVARPAPRPTAHVAVAAPHVVDPGPAATEVVRTDPRSTRMSGSPSTARSRRSGPGQLISLFGDRLHQFALAAIVLTATGSAVAAGRSSSSPPRCRTCSCRPIAGHLRRPLGPQGGPGRQRHPAGGARAAHPDRRDRSTSCSSTRWSSSSTSISIFFRPARVAILPQIVDERRPAHRQLGAVGRRDDRRRHRLPAGRALRGRRSATAVPLAFWLDARDLPRLGGPARRPIVVRRRATGPTRRGTTPAEADGGFLGELKAGLAVPPRRDRRSSRTRSRPRSPSSRSASLIGADRASTRRRSSATAASAGRRSTASSRRASGAGNLIGGFVIGLIGARLAKGRMIIAGYAVWGCSTSSWR